MFVDLRPTSCTCCQWFGVTLDGKTHRALFVPGGMAHGFLTLTDDTIVAYEMFENYHPESNRGVRYDDPAFGIVWPGEVKVISEKDQQWADFGIKGELA